jgi:hypothetical protein
METNLRDFSEDCGTFLLVGGGATGRVGSPPAAALRKASAGGAVSSNTGTGAAALEVVGCCTSTLFTSWG